MKISTNVNPNSTDQILLNYKKKYLDLKNHIKDKENTLESLTINSPSGEEYEEEYRIYADISDYIDTLDKKYHTNDPEVKRVDNCYFR